MMGKHARLLKLVRLRQENPWPGYRCIGDYHGGVYECDFVSPYTRSAGNVDAELMILLQDWSCDEALRGPILPERLSLGHDPGRTTNKRLKDLLQRHFGLKLKDVYATNVFPFVKLGTMSASISMRDLVRAAREFALPCISQLPTSPRAARLAADGSPCPPGVSEPVSELGAPSAHQLSNPNSRSGRRPASPHSQGRVMERSSAVPVFVGIDVVKDRLDVHLRPSGEALAVGRDAAGLTVLVERLAELAPSLVVLEATGGFEVTVAAALTAAQLPLAVVNPRQIRDFARATGRLAKTDRLDAEAIARFAEAVRPEPRPIPDAAARALGELVARRRQIVEMIGSEGQRRRQLRDPRLVRRLDAHLAWLQKELSEIEADLDHAVRASPAWRAIEDLLASVPGIGKTSARTLIAELPELGALDRRKIASLVGVAPVNRDSGTFRGRRMVLGGRASVRKALYMPTLTAIRRNPPIRAL